eukprot:s416_g44.t1
MIHLRPGFLRIDVSCESRSTDVDAGITATITRRTKPKNGHPNCSRCPDDMPRSRCWPGTIAVQKRSLRRVRSGFPEQRLMSQTSDILCRSSGQS